MKSIIRWLVVLVDVYCVSVLVSSAWFMLAIYVNYRDYYGGNSEEFYCVCYLVTLSFFSTLLLLLHGFLVFQNGRRGVVVTGLVASFVAILLLCLLVVCGSYVGADGLFCEIFYSSILYALSIVGMSILVIFYKFRGC